MKSDTPAVNTFMSTETLGYWLTFTDWLIHGDELSSGTITESSVALTDANTDHANWGMSRVFGKDTFGVGYFNGDWTHNFSLNVTAHTESWHGMIWGVVESHEALPHDGLHMWWRTQNGYLACRAEANESDYDLIIGEGTSGRWHTDSLSGLAYNQQYYLSIDHVKQSVPMLYLRAYSDDERTQLLDTAEIKCGLRSYDTLWLAGTGLSINEDDDRSLTYTLASTARYHVMTDGLEMLGTSTHLASRILEGVGGIEVDGDNIPDCPLCED